MLDIITIGSSTRDIFLQIQALHTHPAKDTPTHTEACLPFGSKINVEQIHFDIGGGATNSAVTFARLGNFQVAALTRVGQDSAGNDVLNALRQDHIDPNLVQYATKEATGYSTILYHGGSAAERTILVHRGASQKLEFNKIPWNKLQAQWFYITSLGGDLVLLKKLFAHSKKIGAKIVWNPGAQEIAQFSPPLRIRGGWEGLRQSIDILLINREEAAQLTGVAIDNTTELLRALANFAPVALMTDGIKGAYVVYTEIQSPSRRRLDLPTLTYHIPSGGAKPKNLTGAGDAFGSGFLTGWIKSNGDIQSALRVGTLNSNSVVQHIGAKIGILKKYPSPNQLQQLPVRKLK